MIAFLRGIPEDGQLNGTRVKLTAKFNGEMLSQSESFQAMAIEGQVCSNCPVFLNRVRLRQVATFLREDRSRI